MTENTFFDSIIADCETTEERIIAILKARGFLISHNQNGFFLSDNAALDDVGYLAYGMETFHLGSIENNMSLKEGHRETVLFDDNIRININPLARIEDAISFFKERGAIQSASCFDGWSWSKFANREHGKKVPVNNLESYVSYYVKAVNACGVFSNFSCDGNHPGGGRVIAGADYPFDIWHRLIWENCIESVPFIGDGIRFSNETQFLVYYKLYKIADWLYGNRITFRSIKENAFRDVPNKWLRKQDNETLEKWFKETCDFSNVLKLEV